MNKVEVFQRIYQPLFVGIGKLRSAVIKMLQQHLNDCKKRINNGLKEM